jgi:spore maturation protein CgeB
MKKMKCFICDHDSSLYCVKDRATYYKCKSCGTIFQYPFPTLQEMTDYANKEYKDGMYKKYLDANDLKYATFEYRLKKVLERFNMPKPSGASTRVLDVGCSNGRFIEVALRNNLDAWGVDFSESAKAAASPAVRDRIYLGDANKIDSMGIEKFDIITAFDIIEHLFDPIAFLNNLRKLLRKGGIVVMTTPDASSLLRPMMGKSWSMLQPYQHTILLSRKGCKILLQKSKYDHILISATKKVVTPDYLFGQLVGLNPLLYRMYEGGKKVLPRFVREKYIQVDIGEMMVAASPMESS